MLRRAALRVGCQQLSELLMVLTRTMASGTGRRLEQRLQGVLQVLLLQVPSWRQARALLLGRPYLQAVPRVLPVHRQHQLHLQEPLIVQQRHSGLPMAPPPRPEQQLAPLPADPVPVPGVPSTFQYREWQVQ